MTAAPAAGRPVPTTFPAASEELGATAARQYRSLLALTDRDRDGALSTPARDRRLALQTRIAKGQIQLTLLDHGSGLLDADQNGALSLREFRTVWDRVEKGGAASSPAGSRSSGFPDSCGRR